MTEAVESMGPEEVTFIISSKEELESSMVKEHNLPASAGSYLSTEEELETLCDKDSNPDAHEECLDFKNEMANLNMMPTFLHD